jgi:hypothetical protein
MLTRTRRRALVALVPLAVVPLLVAATHGSSKKLATLSCGQTVTTNTTLDADVGPCPGSGVTINANNVTLNLNGHRITGANIGAGTGVAGLGAADIVQNGTVTGFGFGVSLAGASSRAMNLRVGMNSGAGILGNGNNDVFSGNRAFANAEGIHGTGIGSQFTNNVLQSNGGNGLRVSRAAVISGNKALNNGSAGIDFENAAGGGGGGITVTVTNNIANGNHIGINEAVTAGDPTVVTLSGNKAYFNSQLGIEALAGVTDGGNNKADGNGNAAQCTNVVCT